MIITKQSLKILKYIYKKNSLSSSAIEKKFKMPMRDILQDLVHHNYLLQLGSSYNEYGEPTEITDITMFRLSKLGTFTVESNQWFDLKYVITQIILPIAIAIITTILTLSLSTLL